VVFHVPIKISKCDIRLVGISPPSSTAGAAATDNSQSVND
jgi:hypothetical protein